MQRRDFLFTLLGLAAPAHLLAGRFVPNRNMPENGSVVFTDVLIVGGGAAGFGAAVGAAWTGVSVCLIESRDTLGGLAVEQAFLQLDEMRPYSMPRAHPHELLLNSLRGLGGESVDVRGHQFWCSPCKLGRAMSDRLRSTGCRVLLDTKATQVLRRGNALEGMVVSRSTGTFRIRSKQMVDCTGTHGVLNQARASLPPEADSEGLPVTWRFDSSGPFVEKRSVGLESLIPEGCEGLLCARSVSEKRDPEVAHHGSVGNSMAIGHAAGVAAALMVKGEISSRNPDPGRVRERIDMSAFSVL